MAKRNPDLQTWIRMIKSEYEEMPGLRLTKPQVRRMWGLAEADCEQVLDRLQADHVLRVTPRGCYVLEDSLAVD
jgi:hypothetical protein